MNPSLTKDDGGAAFPRPKGDEYDAQDGMTLRDWFAGQALAGLMANGFVPNGYGETYVKTGSPDSWQARYERIAYAIADCMLSERSK